MYIRTDRICTSFFSYSLVQSTTAQATRRPAMAWRQILRDSSLLLAAVSVALPSSTLLLEAAWNPEKIKEPFTGIEFDQRRDIPQAEPNGDYYLLGTAVRCMLGQCKFAKARAYAVGLYVEDADEELRDAREDSIFQVLVKVHTPRSLVLVMAQDVAGHHVAKGFDRSLLQRVRKSQGGKAGPGKDALRDFTQCFNRKKILRKGSEVCLVWRPDDTLVVIIDSSVYAQIQSPILCEAIFDMYLGPSSIFRKYHDMRFKFHQDSDVSS